MADDHTMGEGGLVKITAEAIASIAAIAARGVNGVAELAPDLVDGVAKLLGRKAPASGVKVQLSEKEVSLAINLVLEYGADIAEVAGQVQRDVARSVEEMSGLVVREVNVNVKEVKGAGKGKKVVEQERIDS